MTDPYPTRVVVASAMSAVQLRAERLSLGLTEEELAAIAGIEHRNIPKWESGDQPVREFMVDVLATLTTAAATLTVELVGVAGDDGVITTHTTDAAARAATNGLIPTATMHQACAGRAAMAVPGTRIVTIDDAGEQIDVEVACLSRAVGLAARGLAEFVGVPYKKARRWFAGPYVPEFLLPHLRTALIEPARRHTAAFSGIDDADAVMVCTTADQLDAHFPDLGLPLATHQVAMLRAARAADLPLIAYPS